DLDQATAVHAVGDHAGGQGEEDQRDHLHAGEPAEGELGLGAIEDLPAQRDGGHLVAGHGDHPAGGEGDVVAVAEGGGGVVRRGGVRGAAGGWRRMRYVLGVEWGEEWLKGGM